MTRTIIVGGGMAGLTAAAYLARSGYNPLMLEKESHVGGLVGSFTREGFTFDWGIRATEDSGILFSMLKQLGIHIPFARNPISLGIEDQVIEIESEDGLNDYQMLLSSMYPDNTGEISEIIAEMRKAMKYMEVQYDIENPTFLDTKEDLGYIFKKVLPWAVRYIITVPKINRLNIPVVSFLEKYTQNRSLIDIITQHFFEENPAYFALSYLKIYLDYYYPLGGTGTLPRKLADYVIDNGGEIRTDTRVTRVDPVERYLIDSEGNRFDYDWLVWAADLKTLYNIIDTMVITDQSTRQAIHKRKHELKDKQGNDSVFTQYIACDLAPSYFTERNAGHFFYTPSRLGESNTGPIPVEGDKETIKKWLKRFASLTTYEISIPLLRDASLAPQGKTGLIISALFDYQLTHRIQEQGWYEEFREYFGDQIIDVLESSIYPGLRASIIDRFTSTPLSIEARTGNAHGAITGWAFTNESMPAESRLPKILSSTETPIPFVVQAGQWTYSPSGLPISILTGKLASDRVISKLKKRG